MSQDWNEKGRAMRAELMGERAAGDMKKSVYTDEIMAKFGDYAIDAVFGGLWSRPGLDLKTRTMITLASDVAQARMDELKIHILFCRRQGWTEDEIAEAILHLAGYVGLPKVRDAMIVARETFVELRDAGDQL